MCLAATLAGCPSDPTPPADAALPDARVFAPSALYEGCEIDAQCPGVGARCRRPVDGYPQGYCTVPCTDRTPCEGLGTQNNQCVQLNGEDQSYCEANCLNGRDCRDGYTCIQDVTPSGGVCIPVCSSDEQCGGGAVCDLNSARCVAPGMTSTGARVGEACGGSGDCAGWCIDEAGNGWPGGLCTQYCVLPAGWNTNTFYEGTLLPSGTCPDGHICYPNGSFAERDLGICLPACSTPEGCRDGYMCRQQWQLQEGGDVFRYDNGVCWPAG